MGTGGYAGVDAGTRGYAWVHAGPRVYARVRAYTNCSFNNLSNIFDSAQFILKDLCYKNDTPINGKLIRNGEWYCS